MPLALSALTRAGTRPAVVMSAGTRAVRAIQTSSDDAVNGQGVGVMNKAGIAVEDPDAAGLEDRINALGGSAGPGRVQPSAMNGLSDRIREGRTLDRLVSVVAPYLPEVQLDQLGTSGLASIGGAAVLERI